jgi:uncharacterized protein
VRLDPFLLEVLACPCGQHSPVTPDPEGQRLVCRRCETQFPVRDGIPVMLLEEAIPGPGGIGGGLA